MVHVRKHSKWQWMRPKLLNHLGTYHFAHVSNCIDVNKVLFAHQVKRCWRVLSIVFANNVLQMAWHVLTKLCKIGEHLFIVTKKTQRKAQQWGRSLFNNIWKLWTQHAQMDVVHHEQLNIMLIIVWLLHSWKWFLKLLHSWEMKIKRNMNLRSFHLWVRKNLNNGVFSKASLFVSRQKKWHLPACEQQCPGASTQNQKRESASVLQKGCMALWFSQTWNQVSMFNIDHTCMINKFAHATP